MKTFTARRLLLVIALCVVGERAAAVDGTWELGVRYNVLASDAPPANDMHGYGLVLQRERGSGWRYGLGVERYEFDYEEPYKVLGIQRPAGMDAIDGSTESTVVSAWIEKEFGGSNRWRWFWSAGVGYSFLTVDTVTGPTANGGEFDIRTEARNEPQLHGSAGLRYRFGTRWSVQAALLAQHHFTDYDIRDAISGLTGSIGSQTPIGISFGFSSRF